MLLLLGPLAAQGEVFQLPADGSDLIGEVRYTRARYDDTLLDIARAFSVGQVEMDMANPTVDRWLPGEGTQVVIPRRFILPNAPRAGIVVNIPEMRLYFYPVQYRTVTKKVVAAKKAKGKGPSKVAATTTEMGEPIGKATEVITYPVSMGRMDWRTPLGKTRIISKVKNPVWIPPESIKREHAKRGDILPDIVPPGANNPLGLFAMKLGVPGYLIHGTEIADKGKPFGIGMRVTHGCMRMYNEDVERLFPLVAVGTPVYLVNQPIKLGWQAGTLYMEVSLPLDEDAGVPPEWGDDALDDSGWDEAQIKAIKAKKAALLSAHLAKLAAQLVSKEKAKHPLLVVDDPVVQNAVNKPTGIPVAIGREMPPPVEATPTTPNGLGPYPAPGVSPPGPAAEPPPLGGPPIPDSGSYDTPLPVPDRGAAPADGNGQGAPPTGPQPYDPYPPSLDDAPGAGRPAPEPYPTPPREAHPAAPPASGAPDPYAPDREEEAPSDQSWGGR
ncbi:L,D-transpeptidase family protein [Candidatus Methylocalor cossyra]|uniref:L,D-transpeptidase family protein n=1 Tax=Candidatus Methylocalor cossyra TaxID=3108543 RepID=UPI0032B2A5C7